MHALRRFIQNELDARGWRAHDLERASGLSRQLISKLVNDDRDVLPQIPRTTTLEALAQAFNVSTAHVTMVAVEALGVADVKAPAVVHQIEDLSDQVLLGELMRRADARELEDAPPAPVPIKRARKAGRPITTIEAELRVAEADLADWLDQKLTGKDAESHEAMLRARVDALRTELVASRSVSSDRDSVAKL